MQDTAAYRQDGVANAVSGRSLVSLVDTFDWSLTKLGPKEAWPQSLRTAVDIVLHSPVPMILIWGLDGPMIYNDGYSEISRDRHPALLGNSVSQGWPEAAQFMADTAAKVLAGKAQRLRNQEFVLERGGVAEKAWFDLAFSPVPDETGRPAGIIAIVSETTSRMRAEQATAGERERQQQALRQMPGFVALLAGPEHRYEYVNDAYVALSGAREFIGRPVREVFPEVIDQGFLELLDRVFADGAPFVARAMPISLDRADGERFIDLLYQPVRDDQGAISGIFVGGYDATDQVRAEVLLRESEERSRRIIEGVKDHGIFTTDMGGTIVDWTPGAEVVFGWSSDEIVGRDCSALFTPEDVAAGAPQQELTTARETGCAADVRWHLRRDGSRFFADGSVRPLHDADGKIGGFIKIARDETERRLIEDRLRSSEELANRVLASSADCIKVLDLDARLEFMTEGGMCVMEVDDFGDIAGLRWPDFWEGVEHDKANTAVAEARAGGTGRFQGFATTLKGTPRWWDVIVTPINGADGQPERLLAVSRDVTREKLAQEAERASGDRFRAAVDAVQGVLWTNSAQGEMRGEQAGWAALTGQSPDEYQGYGWAAAVHPDDAKATIDAWNDAVRERKTFIFEHRVRRHDGAWRLFSIRAIPALDEAGEIREWVGVHTDITAQRLAEDRLRELNETLEARVQERTADRDRMWRLSTDLMLVARLDGTITAVNPAWTTLFGWAEEELLDRDFMDLIHPDDAAQTIAEVGNLSEGLTTLRFENRYRHKDGSYRWLSWTAVPDQRLIHALGRDITGEKLRAEALAQAEEQLRQSQKMEAVGQLTGGIAHDFNNMLAVVMGSLELLKRRIITDDARVHRYADAATEGARRAANLTQRLLAFSRQQPLKPEPIDANKLVVGMSDLLRHSLGAMVQLETVLAGGLWRTSADPNQLENVILNLGVNARDAMPEGGRLTIETQNAHLDDRYAAAHLGLVAGQYVLIAVTDTGTGMPPEVIAKAFDPFFTTKDVGKGTGLGLSQVYGFVKQSGGHVKIYSEAGQGTTIKVYLPRLIGALAVASDAEQEFDIPLGEAQEVILVVEDEHAVRQLSVDALTELGYRTLEADGAASALRLLEAHPEIVLMFTDIVMPEVNGAKLAEAARRQRPDLRVLFTTGYTRNAVVHNGVLDAGVELLGRPFTIEELAAKVRSVLDAPVNDH